jgi:hypothetical protein
MKKILFAAATLLILAQAGFIIVMQAHGKQAFLEIYAALNAEPITYVNFMFRVIAWWWMLPLACAPLSFWTYRNWSNIRAALVLFVNAACLLALCGTSYLAAMWTGNLHVVSGWFA